MSEHVLIAGENFEAGCNCCQALFTAYCDVTGYDKRQAMMLSAPFGGGMGRLREVCGAVTGMFMVAGIKYGYADAKDNEAKAAHYALIQDLAKQFREKHGSIVCRELLHLDHQSDPPFPSERNKAFYHNRACKAFVESAAEILDTLLRERGQL